MKTPAAIVFAIAFILAVGTTFTSSNSQNSFHVHVAGDGEVETRRKALVEFGAQHDWRAELKSRGIELPDGTLDQLLQPLLNRDGLASDGPGIFVEIRLQIDGWRAFYPQFDQIDRAVRVIESRFQLAADFSNLEAIRDDSEAVETRRSRVWSTFGSGFPEETLAGLRDYRTREPSPELQGFLDLLIESLEHRLDSAEAEKE